MERTYVDDRDEKGHDFGEFAVESGGQVDFELNDSRCGILNRGSDH